MAHEHVFKGSEFKTHQTKQPDTSMDYHHLDNVYLDLGGGWDDPIILLKSSQNGKNLTCTKG